MRALGLNGPSNGNEKTYYKNEHMDNKRTIVIILNSINLNAIVVREMPNVH